MENDNGGEVQQEYFCYNDNTQFGDYTGITTAAANHDPFKINAAGAIPDK
jgi:hypothetical protein